MAIWNKKSFLYHLQKPIKLNIKYDIKKESFSDDYINSFQIKVQTSYINQFDEILLDMIFDEFKKSDATDLIVLDRTEFRKFLMKYLPIYMNEKEGNKI